MYIIDVPDDTYTIAAGKYRSVGTPQTNYTEVTYNSETNTSEYFLNKFTDSQNSIISNPFYKYINQNYFSWNYLVTKAGNHRVTMSSTESLPLVNYWMYPLSDEWAFRGYYNYPITRTISIIVNSNTLPIQTIPDITFSLYNYQENKKQQITIPSGDYSCKSFMLKILNLTGTAGGEYFNFYNLQYFYESRATVGLLFYDNEELFKYYGLLHLIFTYPEETVNDKNTAFAFNFPQFRSLHIPPGRYTSDYLCDYINNNDTITYQRGSFTSKPCYQFNAKIVDNDIVIYTTDGTEFFINPVCHLNTYQETNYASEHRLCPVTDCIQYNLEDKYLTGTNINITPVINGNVGTLTATGLPDGLTFNPTTGAITGIISNIDSGYYTVTITSDSFIGDINLTMKILNYIPIIVVDNKFDYTN